MHRRGTRSNGNEKSESNSVDKRKIPHNPFQQSSRHRATHQQRNTAAAIAVCICSFTLCLIGFISFQKPNNKEQTITAVIYPRSFRHDTDDWFLPQIELHTRMHPRELHRARKEREHVINQQTKIIARRRITVDGTLDSSSLDALDSSSESSEDKSDSSSRDHHGTKIVYHDDNDSREHAEGLDLESEGIDCEYNEWQKRNPVACNNVHEVDLRPTPDSFVVLGCGGDRCAIKILDVDGDAVVLKMPKLEEHSRRDWEWSRKDVLIMEQLTSSPYVVDIYGYCGLSHFEEYGGHGNLHDRIKVARNFKKELSPLDKLKICVQIATAVADMHDLDVAHNDICCHQIIFIDGIYKLNDFNLGVFIRRNKRTNTTCRDPQINWMNDLAKMRSPEEVGEPWHDHWFYNLQKVDDYMMGNVMFYVLTNHWTFEGYTAKEAIRMMRRGQRSIIPPKILDKRNPAIRAMLGAIRSCWKQNPAERPSSRKIADFLKNELRRIEKTDTIGVVRVSLPPFPAMFRHTDSDFEKNLVNGYPGQDDLFFNGEQLVSDDNIEWGKSSDVSND